MIFPDFLIPGAARCGTTALQHWLGTHPEIRIPPGEPNFFSNVRQSERQSDSEQLDQEMKIYQAAFQGCAPAAGRVLYGEKSVGYLYPEWAEDTVRAILRLHPGGKDVKIIILLRDPIERAYSHYLCNRAAGIEPLSFSEAVEAWEARRRTGAAICFDYLGVSSYSRAVAAYLHAFRQVRVGWFEGLINQPLGFVTSLFAFLGVETNWRPPNLGRNPNPARVPRSLAAHALYRAARHNPLSERLLRGLPSALCRPLQGLARRWIFPRPELDPALRTRLMSRLAGDLTRLENLLDRPVPPSWRRHHATAGAAGVGHA